VVVPLNQRATEVTRSRFGPRLRRLQVETSMGPGVVVVSDVGLEDPLATAGHMWLRSVHRSLEQAADLRFLSWGGQDLNLRPTDYESAALTD
jgi:hypothetical protein